MSVQAHCRSGGRHWRSSPGLLRLPVMTKAELIIQLIKIALGAAIGAYFVWWSVEVLHRLPPH
jgi:hypothetical protein